MSDQRASAGQESSVPSGDAATLSEIRDILLRLETQVGGRRRRRLTHWAWIIGMLVGVPLLYVGSFGPACWWVSETGSGIASPPISSFYRPISYAAKKCPAFFRAMDWYGGWWIWPHNYAIFVAQPDLVNSEPAEAHFAIVGPERPQTFANTR